jgi:transmembrane E3 ubiquitin-protein ligase
VIQVATLIGQDYFGPTWFIPDFVRFFCTSHIVVGLHYLQWNTGSEYDYHPDLGKPDEESAEPKLGDCAICMESISADQGDVGHERGIFLQLCWKQAAKRRRVYALSPCGHNFVRYAYH